MADKRKQIQLPEEWFDELAAIRKETGVRENDSIRSAVAKHLAEWREGRKISKEGE